MATLKQKIAFGKLVENGGNVTQAMKDAKYSPASYNNPKALTDSDGFKELCEEAGLTDEFLLGSLRQDIEKKPQNRTSELRLAFEVTGKLKDRKESQTYNFVNIFNVEQTRKIAGRVLNGDPASEEESN